MILTLKNIKKLIKASFESQEYAYSPYSGFKVGAAILTRSGKIFKGANIECASFSLTLCAERTVTGKAVSEGYNDIAAIAISTNKNYYAFPCGACRQFLSEFNPELKIILAKSLTDYKIFNLKELLPNNFTLKP
ncbi:MAG: cytidine deaminase [Ignavibacteria bacterium]|nr:cytidine deaminase [Ignavibacteria bacterium]